MNVAVFDASGFVGRNIIEALKFEDIMVKASDVKKIDIEGVDFVEADILNYNEVSKVIKGTDIVIHLAVSLLPVSLEKPRINARINIDGSFNIINVASKAATDQLVFSYCKTFGIDASIIRPFNNYGSIQNEKSYAGVIPLTIKRILNNELPVIYGDGKQTRDYLYVTDTVNAAIEVYN